MSETLLVNGKEYVVTNLEDRKFTNYEEIVIKLLQQIEENTRKV